MLASAVIAVVAYLAAENPYQTIQMDIVIIAAIMPIVPGAAITTAVRDTMQGDYVAGGAKALEAFVSAAAIAAGVSFGMILTGRCDDYTGDSGICGHFYIRNGT